MLTHRQTWINVVIEVQSRSESHTFTICPPPAPNPNPSQDGARNCERVPQVCLYACLTNPNDNDIYNNNWNNKYIFSPTQWLISYWHQLQDIQTNTSAIGNKFHQNTLSKAPCEIRAALTLLWWNEILINYNRVDEKINVNKLN